MYNVSYVTSSLQNLSSDQYYRFTLSSLQLESAHSEHDVDATAAIIATSHYNW